MRTRMGWTLVCMTAVAMGGCRWPRPATQPATKRPPRFAARQFHGPLAMGMAWAPKEPRQGQWVDATLVIRNETRYPLVVVRTSFKADDVYPLRHKNYQRFVQADEVRRDEKAGTLVVVQHWQFDELSYRDTPEARLPMPPTIAGAGLSAPRLLTCQLVLPPGGQERLPYRFQANVDGRVFATATVRYAVVRPEVLERNAFEFVEGNRWAKATPEQALAELRRAQGAELAAATRPATRPRRRSKAFKPPHLVVEKTYRPVGPDALASPERLKGLVFIADALGHTEQLRGDFVLPVATADPPLPVARRQSGLRPTRVMFLSKMSLWAFGDGQQSVLVGKQGRVAQFTRDHTALFRHVEQADTDVVRLSFQASPAQKPAFYDAVGGQPKQEKMGTSVPIARARLIDVLKLAENHQVRITGWR